MIKLDPNIFTDELESAAAEKALTDSVNDYGKEYFAALVDSVVKRGELTKEEGEQKKRDYAALSEAELDALAAEQQKETPSEVGNPYEGLSDVEAGEAIFAELIADGIITPETKKAATTDSPPRHKPARNPKKKARGRRICPNANQKNFVRAV
jgi:polyhydroxyalkanoate synthesis regulator phasin